MPVLRGNVRNVRRGSSGSSGEGNVVTLAGLRFDASSQVKREGRGAGGWGRTLYVINCLAVYDVKCEAVKRNFGRKTAVAGGAEKSGGRRKTSGGL